MSHLMSQGTSLFSLHLLLPDAILHAISDPRSVNTAVEFTKIYQGLALIEAHVDHIRGSRTLSGSIPTPQPSPDASIIPGPSQLKESLLNSDPCEPEVAPGARGESNRSGLYAGPTSTVSHLTVVCLLLVSHSSAWY